MTATITIAARLGLEALQVYRLSAAHSPYPPACLCPQQTIDDLKQKLEKLGIRYQDDTPLVWEYDSEEGSTPSGLGTATCNFLACGVLRGMEDEEGPDDMTTLPGMGENGSEGFVPLPGMADKARDGPNAGPGMEAKAAVDRVVLPGSSSHSSSTSTSPAVASAISLLTHRATRRLHTSFGPASTLGRKLMKAKALAPPPAAAMIPGMAAALRVLNRRIADLEQPRDVMESGAYCSAGCTCCPVHPKGELLDRVAMLFETVQDNELTMGSVMARMTVLEHGPRASSVKVRPKFGWRRDCVGGGWGWGW